MNNFKYIMLFVVISFTCFGKPSDRLLSAISKVESNNISTKINIKENAFGAYQIRKVYIDDVNRIFNTNYTHIDAFDIKKAKSIVTLYLTYWGKKYEKKTGKVVNDEIYARIHNGGPNGWNKKSTEIYWNKIKKILDAEKRNSN